MPIEGEKGFAVRVEREIQAAHHNGPKDSKCHRNHGHAWGILVEIWVPQENLDQYGWGVDFHVLKDIIDQYDHQDLNTLLSIPSAECLAIAISSGVHAATGYKARVTVQEGKGNTLTYYP